MFPFLSQRDHREIWVGVSQEDGNKLIVNKTSGLTSPEVFIVRPAWALASG